MLCSQETDHGILKHLDPFKKDHWQLTSFSLELGSPWEVKQVQKSTGPESQVSCHVS